ncbi:hypothetical protein DSO57_1021405 [Entomophthora muscae]|uniref:Uncharacterized protein n=1 Tax=Entomophthora muscae TaxID=34485 RepID=A0ACC2TQL3_9FUNG|nr:hypothetical protein DSO57_1021405 [Entomophthora muscae]
MQVDLDMLVGLPRGAVNADEVVANEKQFHHAIAGKSSRIIMRSNLRSCVGAPRKDQIHIFE